MPSTVRRNQSAKSAHKAVWKLEDAKARFSEVVRAAQREPQVVTVRGEEMVIISSVEEYRRRAPKGPEMTPLEFFQSLGPAEFLADREEDYGRDVEV